MSQPIPPAVLRSFLLLLLLAFKSKREALSHYGVETQGARIGGMLDLALQLGLIPLLEYRVLQHLASNAGEHRGSELRRQLPPYGSWPQAKHGVAA